MGMGMMDPGMMQMMGPGPDLSMGFDMPPGISTSTILGSAIRCTNTELHGVTCYVKQ